MIFYRIKLLSVPKVKYAQHVDLSKYRNRFNHAKDYLEFTVVEKGDIFFKYQDREDVAKPGMFFPIVSDMACETYANGRQVHNIVGVKVKYELERYSSKDLTDEQLNNIEESIRENTVILVPYIVELNDDYSYVVNSIASIVRTHGLQGSGDELLCVSKWFGLASYLTKITMRMLVSERAGFSPMAYKYVEEAKRYIKRNINRKILIEEVAENVGISINYLQKLFKLLTDETVVSYINSKKMQIAAEYMIKNNTGAQEAAEYVGIDDSSYFCRLFKKYYGFNIREYRIQKG